MDTQRFSAAHQPSVTPTRASSGWRCAIVGDELLAAQCGEVLLEQGLDITVVATVQPQVRAWAQDKGIPCVRSDQALATELAAHTFDVLLSIANLRILPPDVLSQAKVAINFHDGPLPGYAGLNVTCWALLAGEFGHAVTWHLMTDAVDAGEVLAVEPLPILPDDTAFSLNARCFEAGGRSFERVARALAAGAIDTRPQADGQRQTFKRWQRPLGLMDPRQPAAYTDRLIRALHLGARQFQQLGAVRLWLQGDVRLLTRVRVQEGVPGVPPGTVRSIGADGICLATPQGWLWLLDATRVCGAPCDLAQWAKSHGLSAGSVWPTPPDELMAALSSTDALFARHEPRWLDRLAGLEVPDLPLLRLGAVASPQASDRPEWGSLPLQGVAASQAVTLAELGATWATWQWRTGATGDAVWTQMTDASRRVDVALQPCVHAPVARLAAAQGESWADLVQRVSTDALASDVPWLKDLVARDPRTRGHWPAVPLALLDHAAPADLTTCMAHLAPDTLLCLMTADPAATDPAPRLAWRKDRLTDAVAQRLADQIGQLLASARTQPQTPWSQLNIVTPQDQTALSLMNQTARDYDSATTLEQLHAGQARLRPDAPALSFGPVTLTHAQLSAAAAHLAHRLQAAGVARGDRVGLGVSRGLPMVIGMLAVWQCGAAYVPLDPTYPADRISFMIDDAALQAVLVDPGSEMGLGRPGLAVLEAGAPDPAELTAPLAPLPATHTADDLAYLIYTSGSTGKPKGVMVTHRNALNFLAAMDDILQPDGPVTWLSVTSLSFDISVLELAWTLTRGHHVVLKADRGVPSVAPDIARPASAAQPRPPAAGGKRPVSMSLYYFAAGEAPASAGYRLLMEGAKFADANGFEAIWTPERHFHAFGGFYPNPSVVGAAVAVLTKNVHIRGGSVVLPLHSPVRVAEEWSVVDNLSDGRTGIAVAAGWQPNDFVLNPTGYNFAREKLAGGIDMVRRLWRGETVDFDGPDGRVIPVRTLPRPVQPELPVWLTTAGNPASFVQAGQLGLNLLTHLLGQSVDVLTHNLKAYREAWQAAGHAGEGRVTLMLHTYLAHDGQQAREVARPALKAYLSTAAGLIKNMASAFPTFARAGKDADEAFKSLTEDEVSQLLDMATARYLDTSGLFGTPTEAADMIDAVSGIGVDEVACLIDYGVDADAVIASFDLLLKTKYIVQSRRAPEAYSAQIIDAWDDSTAALVARHQVTHLQCTPSQAAMLVADPADRQALTQVRHMLVGGEALPTAMGRELRDLLPGRFTNMYGPTETTIWSLSHEINLPPSGAVPIGRPLANTQVHVLDANGLPVPVGVWGELHIGGDGVTRGYHGRDELTAERFVNRPVLGRLYATGDVVRIHPDGWVEFAGRSDHQVKIRGHRIELGEIEAVLDTHPLVVQSVVVARDDGAGPELVAYVALRAGSHVEPQALRQHVGRSLMAIMVPAQVVVLPALPLTPNGKVDRKALPAPLAAASKAGPAASAAPVSDHGPANAHPPGATASHSVGEAADVEATVAAIWSEALGKPAGRDDNFFEIGGHSLMAVMVFRKLSALLPVTLALTDIFRFPTIRAFAAHVRAAWPKAPGGADPSGSAPEAPAQPVGTVALDRGALRRRAIQQRGGA